MISVPDGTGDIPCGYDICFADDIRFAYEGTDIIMSAANNKVPGYPLEIFDFVSGSGSYIIFAKQVYHTALAVYHIEDISSVPHRNGYH